MFHGKPRKYLLQKEDPGLSVISPVGHGSHPATFPGSGLKNPREQLRQSVSFHSCPSSHKSTGKGNGFFYSKRSKQGMVSMLSDHNLSSKYQKILMTSKDLFKRSKVNCNSLD